VFVTSTNDRSVLPVAFGQMLFTTKIRLVNKSGGEIAGEERSPIMCLGGLANMVLDVMSLFLA
jgi:hypothetical protein